MPQIRLVNHGFSCEIIYFLEEDDPTKIHNRILKHNTSILCTNPETYLPTLIGLTSITAKDEWDYHGEIPLEHLKSSLKDFFDKIIKAMPKGYVFYHAGINVAKKPIEIRQFDRTTGEKYVIGKFGNIELKFHPEEAVLVEGETPDKMIVINLHLSSILRSSFTSKGKKIPPLRSDIISGDAKKFLANAKSFFDEYASLGTTFTISGFIPSDHPSTALHLKAHKDAVVAKAEAAAKAKAALAFAKVPAPKPAPAPAAGGAGAAPAAT